MEKIPHLKRYLFRERLVRAILKEWREKKDKIYLRSIYYKYDLPYFKCRDFLSKLARDNVVVIVKEDKDRIIRKPHIAFSLPPEGVERLNNELLYASTI